MPAAEFSPQYLSEWFFAVKQAIPPERQVYLVGGAVRDALLHLKSHDLDFVLQGDAVRLARQVANSLGGAYYLLDSQRGTGRVILDPASAWPVTLDFSRQRGTDLHGDLAARDFTINAIAVPLHSLDKLIDPLAGKADLRTHRLRACSDLSIQEDPLRILRAARLAKSFDLRIDRRTLGLIRAGIPLLPRVSAERRRDEIFRILEDDNPEGGIKRLVSFGAAAACFPGSEQLRQRAGWGKALRRLGTFRDAIRLLVGDQQVSPSQAYPEELVALREAYRQNINTHLADAFVPGRSRLGLLSLAAVYQGVFGESCSLLAGGGNKRAQSSIEKIGEQLVLSGPEIDTWLKACQAQGWIVGKSEEGGYPDQKEIYRYFRTYGPAGLDGCLLALGSARGNPDPRQKKTIAAVCRQLFDAWWVHPAQSVSPPVLVDGSDLQAELGLHPGPQIGRLLEEIREAQVQGSVTTRKQALELARNRIERV